LTLEANRDTVQGAVMNVGSNAANIQKQALAEMVRDAVPGTTIEYVHREVDPRSYRVDFSRITEKLGFEAKWTIADGVQETVGTLVAGLWSDPKCTRYYN